MIYTEKEQLVKDRTVQQAIDAALTILNDRHNGKVRGFKPQTNRPPEEKISLMELNKITEAVIEQFYTTFYK